MCSIAERQLATGLHRSVLTTAVIVGGLAGIPLCAFGQPPMRSDSTAAVFVSRRELRVMFPPESKAVWEWPINPGVEDAPTFFWYATFHGSEGRVGLGVSLDARDSVRVAPSFKSVVRAAKVERCHLSAYGRCTERGVKADVEGRRVIIALQDSALIARLFALRPDSVPIVTHAPRNLGDTRWSSARVHYVEPRLTDLDSAGRAKAVENQREYDARVLTLGRSLWGRNESELLWLVVGDSAELGIEEWECRGNLCGPYHGYRGAPQDWGRWSVVDPRIARVHRSSANDGDPRFAGHRDQVQTIVALRPGRTKVRTVGVHTPADSVASATPLDSIMEREVLVMPQISRLSISPRPATMIAGDSIWFSVHVLDRMGRRIEGAPVELSWGVARNHYAATATKPVVVSFDDPGRYEIIAVLGNYTDTVNVDVRPAPRAP